jgi:hypothetical protein
VGLKAVATQNPASVAITGGAGVPIQVASWGIPLIKLSSGSVSAVGAISAITALPRAYPNAYCYFPANILATSIAAGWYYCTFSTTTAGTAFLDTYSGTGVPTIPSSPVAVTDGKGAFTGDTTERTMSFTVPANALGTNGHLYVEYDVGHTNSAGNKVARIYYSTTGGTTYAGTVLTTSVWAMVRGWIRNAGRTDRQQGSVEVRLAGSMLTSTADSVGTADTTAATTAVISHTNAVATDNAIILGGRVFYVRDN